MIAAKDKGGNTVYVTFCDDTEPNKGGYYCQIYSDYNLDDEVDNLVIHNSWLSGAKDKLRVAEKIATQMISDVYIF